ncbi:EAL domain-containing protein [Massilia sp. HP4]|uniref:bifunctional diguanylate cyclase/phosphodiesterase n=1 Tax=Massilia sp. HP4 TaxID=2562316 RepID=UPI0010C07027|nr:EAL domain-containing protein [Massilia sp. HP4]
MSSPAASPVPSRLRLLYGRSLYGALLLVVFVGLLVPSVVGSYLLVGVQERSAAAASLNDTLQRDADILALGMQEPLWNLNMEAARPLLDSMLRDPAVAGVEVHDLAGNSVLHLRSPGRPLGKVLRAERPIVVEGKNIGKVALEMDDYRSGQELRAKQRNYALVVALQLAVSLLLIALLLRSRLLSPLRSLMRFSDRLARGDFETPLALSAQDELGRLGEQMERMRLAIRDLFADVARREEQFRTIVTQVPGAVYRVRAGGPIEFVSDAIEGITGYPSARFMCATTEDWAAIVHPEDRRDYYRTARTAARSGAAYEMEYRIIDAHGIERWVQEHGQPQAAYDPALHGTEGVRVDGIISDISERRHDEMRIEALLAEQGAILDNVMFGVLFVRQRRIISSNRRCEELFGYAEGEMVGQSTEILYPTHAEYERIGIEQYPLLERSMDLGEERQLRHSDGSLFWCLMSGCALDPNRANEGSIWVFADITERKLAEEKLRLSANVLEHIADGVMVLDVHGRIVATNPAFSRITGYAGQEALGRESSLTRGTRNDQAFYDELWRQLDASGFWRGEIWDTRKDGEAYLEALTVSAVRDDDGATTHYVCVFSDITRERESQDQLDHLAHHDALTALPNRLLYHDRLRHAMARAERDGEQLAVLFIDLDRFKNVNDTLGHHVGDELLKQAAQALSRCLREGDTLARLGGDEFIVLLEDVDGLPGATRVAEKLMAMFEQPFEVSGHELFVTGSVGISLYPQDGRDMHMLIRNADVAMYQAKARGRNGFRFYAPSMSGDGAVRLRMEALLRRAIEKSEIYLAFQPQVEIDSGRLVGVEALLRWNSPELGQVAPSSFIPLAEDTGFIGQLGQWVLQHACRQMVAWEAQGLSVPKIAVNLSVRQFERGGMAATVAAVLEDAGLAPARLQLEVTESAIMNTSDALQYVNDLHAIGVALAIDDFGTGYSSLAYLKQLPVQTLKIDRSFIKDIPQDPDDEAIAIAIIQLGKSMDLSVIAEGVEREDQAAFLLRHGCNLAQGYLYGKPLPAEEILARWGSRQDA